MIIINIRILNHLDIELQAHKSTKKLNLQFWGFRFNITRLFLGFISSINKLNDLDYKYKAHMNEEKKWLLRFGLGTGGLAKCNHHVKHGLVHFFQVRNMKEFHT